MRKIKFPASYHSPYFVLIGLLLWLPPVDDNYSPSKTAQKEKIIVLTKDARSNGYKVIVEDGNTYFEANNVVDPESKKLIEQLHRLSYRCNPNDQVILTPLTFTKGKSNRIKTDCILVFIQPKIILSD